jgi:hypothetical protein
MVEPHSKKVRPLNYKFLQLIDLLILICKHVDLLSNRTIFSFEVLFLGPPGGPPGGPVAVPAAVPAIVPPAVLPGAPPGVLQLPGNAQGNATSIVKALFHLDMFLIQHENLFFILKK